MYVYTLSTPFHVQYQVLVTTPLRAAIQVQFHPPNSKVKYPSINHNLEVTLNVRFKASAASSKESHEPNSASLQEAF